jgi:DNA-binding CsgD family transcriptional regulator
MHSLGLTDVEAIVRILAEAGDPTTDRPLVDRKKLLLEGLANLVEADVWLWSTAVQNPHVPGDVMTVSLLDGGWKDDAQRVGVYRFLSEPATAVPVQAPVAELAKNGRHSTVDPLGMVPADVWSRHGQTYYALGLQHCLLSIYPINPQVMSCVGLHRSQGREPFGERERAITHVVLQQVDWLHRHGTDVPAKDDVLPLSARERQVLIFLLGGDSRRQIAHRLGLSEHTITDYIKNIYRQLRVNSRGELLSLFISGGRLPEPRRKGKGATGKEE